MRFRELGAGIRAGDHVVGFLRHAAGHLGAEPFGQCLCFVAASCFTSVPVKTTVLPVTGDDFAISRT